MFEREYLVAQINRFGGNISRTASFVGMERSALHRKLKSLNVISAGPQRPRRGSRGARLTGVRPAEHRARMKIIICGAGQVGGQIARHLAREEGANQVTIIDKDAGLVRRITDAYDVNGIVGFASHPDILERAGARDADMIIAATQSDEVNMVVCQVANSIFSVPRKIARLRAPSYLNAIYSDLYRRDHLPIDVVISPEYAVADAVMQRLAAPAAFDIEGFLDGKAQLVGITLDAACAVLDTPLRQLSELFSTLRVVVVGVRRAERLFVPEPSDQLYGNDQIYLVTATEDLPRVMEVFGKQHQRVERLLIVGAGNIGLHVAQTLEAGRAQEPAQDHREEPRPRRGGRRRAEADRGPERRRPRRRPARGGQHHRHGRGAGADRRRQDQHPRLRPREDRGREAGGGAGQRPLADRADRADGDRRLRQPALDHRLLDPALRPPRPHPRGLFHRRRRGGGDRGAGARHLGHGRQGGARRRAARVAR